MLFGVYDSWWNKGDARHLMQVFTTPIQIVSQQRLAMANGMNYASVFSPVRAQRWEIEAGIAPNNTTDSFAIQALLNGRFRTLTIGVPQVGEVLARPDLPCYLYFTRIRNTAQCRVGSTWVYYDQYINPAVSAPVIPGQFFNFHAGVSGSWDEKLYVVTAIEDDVLHFWPPLQTEIDPKDLGVNAYYTLSHPLATYMMADVPEETNQQYTLGILGGVQSRLFIEAIKPDRAGRR
jgi:hypothetical protein